MTQHHEPWHKNEDIFESPTRYERYALAHHVAGHHWAGSRTGRLMSAAGLHAVDHDQSRSRLDGAGAALDGSDTAGRASRVALALLVEGTAIEAKVHDLCDLPFDDIDIIDVLGIAEHARMVSNDPSECQCPRSSKEVLEPLRDEDWFYPWVEQIVLSWPNISELARTLHSGRVLEADQVRQILYRRTT
ncbi:hypothetical protein ABFT23_02075 [Nocardioides sp. C4-1]|uniref:hypothetical protein n=1 Tax=Nocardioides sp. C4-1 TaxID=3151851 RepID=UPI0032651DFC